MNSEHKIITDKTFEVIRSAVNKMVDLIKPTFGPAGNKVIIEKLPYRMVVDDGVQIARDFELDDPVENAVVKIIRETAIATNDRAGDGTTSSLIMLQAIINEIHKLGKINGREIENELKKGLDEVKQYLKDKSVPIETKEDLERVARISFDDEKISKMIADLYFKLGKDGIIKIDKSSTMETYSETSDGVKIKSGYISPYMVLNTQRMETEIPEPYIMITDYRLTKAEDVINLLNKIASLPNKSAVIIIADNIEQSALSTLLVNLPTVINPHTKSPGQVMSVSIACPQVSDKKQYLEDLALLTGARAFMQSKGDDVRNVEITDLGRAESIVINKDETIIVGPQGKKEDVAMAITDLRLSIQNEKDKNKKERLQERLSIFTNTIAVIKVGAPTENERKALKYKVEDSINAVKLAYNNGVVCGAGLTLAEIKTSSPILNKALKYPKKQLMENMGIDEYDKYNTSNALNVVTGKIGQFLDVGVVDPTSVLESGVESAVSIASLLVTSTGMIVESQSKNN